MERLSEGRLTTGLPVPESQWGHELSEMVSAQPPARLPMIRNIPGTPRGQEDTMAWGPFPDSWCLTTGLFWESCDLWVKKEEQKSFSQGRRHAPWKTVDKQAPWLCHSIWENHRGLLFEGTHIFKNFCCYLHLQFLLNFAELNLLMYYSLFYSCFYFKNVKVRVWRKCDVQIINIHVIQSRLQHGVV